MTRGNIHTIPAGVPFAQAMAAELLRRTKDDPQALAQYRILLPTRRACRVMRDAFLRESGGKPLLLPMLQPLGDVEEDVLAIETAGLDPQFSIDLPPAIPALRRKLLLAQAVRHYFREEDGGDMAPEHALRLAADLAGLMDRTYTEGLALSGLTTLVREAEYAAHWQRTLKFLEILSVTWPQILAAQGYIDAADRRNRLINALAAHWLANPPVHPVIAAGSTGSIPAAARLMKTIAGLPRGEIVLPGLDTAIDDDQWACMDDTHPQATLKNLLSVLGVERRAVKNWPGAVAANPARAVLAREVMRPGDVTAAWSDLNTRKIDAASLDNLSLIAADTPQEEAQVIALMLRETLEHPGRTASLVTPDRDLARRVAALMARYGVRMDDSAGVQLSQTKAAIFMRLCAEAVAEKLAPAALLSFLRHDMASGGLARIVFEELVAHLELAALRGPKTAPGIEGLRLRLQKRSTEKNLPFAQAHEILARLADIFAPLTTLSGRAEFSTWLDAHLKTVEAAAATDRYTGADILWAGDEGEALAAFLDQLQSERSTLDAALPQLDAQDYLLTLLALMEGETARTPAGLHPRLTILGQLEARLLQADLVIMGGLSEGTWPADPGHDTWMSRPMMREFGLPSPERSIGLAAHDFVQGFCAPRVAMTRSKRRDGAPTVPARWVQRLETVMDAAKLPRAALAREGHYIAMARRMDRADEVRPAARPGPAPALPRRPRRLSVTDIDTLLRDPYGVYAKHVLRLRPLDALEKPPGADDRGNILHEIMQNFIAATKDKMPDVKTAEKKILDTGSEIISRRTDDPGFWEFWWPRFTRIASWTAVEETEWRTRATPLAMEVKGEMKMTSPGGEFTLSARADRIDRMNDGTYAIMDYKSGGVHKSAKIETGDAPQLPLEALILESGGFAGVSAGSRASWLGYRVMKGGREVASVESVDGVQAADATSAARDYFPALIAAYDDAQRPYDSLPDPDRAPRYNDYAHLARVQEWTALSDTDDGEGGDQ